MPIRTLLTKFAGAALLLLAATAQAQQQAVAARDTALFAGPDGDYPLIMDIDSGFPLFVYGCTGGYTWCDVAYGDYRGWIDGRDVEFAYQDQSMPVYDYGPRFALPVISFSIGTYWNRWYYDRPFYNDRPRWQHHAPPPRFWRGPPRDWRHGGHDGDRDHDHNNGRGEAHGPDRGHDHDRNDGDHRGPNRPNGPSGDDHRDDHRNDGGRPDRPVGGTPPVRPDNDDARRRQIEQHRPPVQRQTNQDAPRQQQPRPVQPPQSPRQQPQTPPVRPVQQPQPSQPPRQQPVPPRGDMPGRANGPRPGGGPPQQRP